MKYEINIPAEEMDEIVRKELMDFLEMLIDPDQHLFCEDHLHTPILIGALITVIKAYSTPAQLADLVELMKAGPSESESRS